MKRILSLGAGVQSSTILLMSEHGDLPRLDCAIFADTGDEPQEVYDWLEYLKSQTTIPVHVVGRGYSISKHVLERVESGKRLDKPPFWSATTDGQSTPINRDCTREWKVKVIERKTKELLGLTKADRWPTELSVETWLGISMDEKQRMKASVTKWQRIWHPLIEGPRPLSRSGCSGWMLEHGYPIPPESSCWHCPFHGNARWRHLRDNCPDDWAKAVKFDKALRAGKKLHGMERPVFLHRQLVPLDEAKIDTDQLSLFEEECHGVCGV